MQHAGLGENKMDAFGSHAGGSGKLDSSQREQLMGQVKSQIALANAQELLQKMTDKCFKKCITKPGTSLDNSEQKCIAMCMDRYMDAWNTVSRAYNQRLQKERHR
ncbi:mitochondrial import inner membrane translocase subunit Tim13-like [Antedon mediterranea]|uniref:mitochondrial import inner membrane translocase subunit Tim13-like n=1 Tax=Antedon mediterranea TaxID=105859 RepID=UPI003AF80E79